MQKNKLIKFFQEILLTGRGADTKKAKGYFKKMISLKIPLHLKINQLTDIRVFVGLTACKEHGR